MIIWFICTMIVYFEITGWALYRCHAIQGDNWWDATKKLMWSSISCVRKWCKKFLELLTEELTGQPSPDKTEEENLILSTQEALKLIEKFSGNPYEEPTLASYQHLEWGALKFDVYALGLTEKYKSLSKEDLRRKIFFIIRNFYLETREQTGKVYCSNVSPERFSIIVTLSKNGERIMEEKIRRRALEKEEAGKSLAKSSPKEAVPDEPEPVSKPNPEQETDS